MDPYRVSEGHPEAEGLVCTAVVEVVQPPSTESMLYSTLDAERYEALLLQLNDVDPGSMDQKEKLAFWLNLYNSIVMHAYVQQGATSSADQWQVLVSKIASCRIGGIALSASDIAQALTQDSVAQRKNAGACSPRSSTAAEASTLFSKPLWLLESPEPLAAFGLCGGTFLAPPLRVFHSSQVHAMLEDAFSEYVRLAVAFTSDGGAPWLEADRGGGCRIQIPERLHWYGSTSVACDPWHFEWLAVRLPPLSAQQVRRLVANSNQHDHPQQVHGSKAVSTWSLPPFVQVAPSDWTFRYLLDIPSIMSQQMPSPRMRSPQMRPAHEVLPHWKEA
eukprot:TRINITY_DN18995_c0_g1_i1.p1 TRINITY_DN18995_c0_g1~~TRINITY_DN18995_c0_g1_i1.p1  ORF type:complete len:374 (+),score=51.24 TRINITY_DN18995_c0_g1_i1:129-1124(+)